MKLFTTILLFFFSVGLFSQKTQETRSFSTPEKVIIDGKMQVSFHNAEKAEIVIEANGVELKDIYTTQKNN